MNLLLLHGAWHGAWYWEKLLAHLRPLLPDSNLHCLDFYHHGQAAALPAGARRLSLRDYAAQIRQRLAEEQNQWLLLGHSMAGLPMSLAAAEQALELGKDQQQIRGLIYLAAYLPQPGDSLLRLAQQDKGSYSFQQARLSADKQFSEIPQEALQQSFYADCDAATFNWARAQAQAEPWAPMREKLKFDETALAALPKVYISCEQDQAISPALQQQMQRAYSLQAQASLDSGHCPMLSQPQTLAHLIQDLIKKHFQ